MQVMVTFKAEQLTPAYFVTYTHTLSLLRCHDETIFERVKKCKLALKDRLFKQNIFLAPLSITYEGIDI